MSLFPLFYVIREFHRFLHRGKAMIDLVNLGVCSGSIPTLHGTSLPAVPDELDGESSSSFENCDVSLPQGPTPLIDNSVPLESTVINNPLVYTP